MTPTGINVQRAFTSLQNVCWCPICLLFPHCHALIITDFIFALVALPFPECDVNGITLSISPCAWFHVTAAVPCGSVPDPQTLRKLCTCFLGQCRPRKGRSSFFLKILFIYSQRQRERQRHRQREKQAPYREPDVGLDPGSPGSRPGLQAALNRCTTGAALGFLPASVSNYDFLGTGEPLASGAGEQQHPQLSPSGTATLFLCIYALTVLLCYRF